jgi:hypothetical protein
MAKKTKPVDITTLRPLTIKKASRLCQPITRFQAAIQARHNNAFLEHELRSVRIALWVQEELDLTRKQAEQLFDYLVELISASDDEFDSEAMKIAHEIFAKEDR